MNSDTIERLVADCADKPAGIAVLVDATVQLRLIQERAWAIDALKALTDRLLDEVDLDVNDRPNLAMRLVNELGPQAVLALARAVE